MRCGAHRSNSSDLGSLPAGANNFRFRRGDKQSQTMTFNRVFRERHGRTLR